MSATTSASTTFFAQQSANRRKSLLLLLSVGVLLGVLGFAIGYGMSGDPLGALGPTAIAVTLAFLLGAGSYYGGDAAILAASQAEEVTEATHQQLLNVVREMALAANVPMPRVYVIPDSALNAFATGRGPDHASVAVTQGLLDVLDREELQGVIAHELGHVRNYDIRFMLLIGVLVGGVALLSDMFLRYGFLYGGRRRGRSNNSGGGGLQLIMMALAILFAILAPIAARLVQLSVSRQREYLADATAVELTRNPVGIERALWKLGTDREVLEAANRSTQHLYVVNPIRKFEERASAIWATHPPLADRIDRLRELHSAPRLTAQDRRILDRH